MTPDEQLAIWKAELKKLDERLVPVLLDDETAWMFRAMALKNNKLDQGPARFLNMFWFGYIHRTAIQLRAMADANPASLSYTNLLKDILRHHDVLVEAVEDHTCPSMRTIREWEKDFLETVGPVKRFTNKEVAHWNRKGAPNLGYTELRRALYEARRLHQRLFFTFTAGHLEVMPTQLGNWMSVFESPWWPEDADPQELQEALLEAQLESLADAEEWPRRYWGHEAQPRSTEAEADCDRVDGRPADDSGAG